VCSGVSEARRGYDEARQARDWAHAAAGVVALLEARVSDYLLQRADATAQRMIPAAARRLFESSAPADRVLIETLLAYAAADMAVRVTAERISVHPNTVTYRLDKMRKLLGKDPTRYSDLAELLTWARLLSC
jgi:DNA-binding PucR family transcriptional regulator